MQIICEFKKNMVVKSKKSKQLIVEGEMLFINLINNAVSPASY